MERPSIAMIPSAYKDGIVYSVLPINGGADLTFTRATSATSFNATRVENDNEIQEVASNTPRLDYSGSGCPSLLLEPESTNLATYSEDFSQISSVGSTILTNNSVSPNGEINANLWVANDTSDGKELEERHTVVMGTTYTESWYVKYDSLQFVQMVAIGSVFGSKRANFDILNGIIGDNNYTHCSIKEVGNGWFRISATQEGINNGFGRLGALRMVSSLTAIKGGDLDTNGTESVEVWGHQVEALPYATSYIPTSGAIETRVAETLSKSGLSDYINSSEGVVYADIKALSNDSTYRRISLNSSTTNSIVTLDYKDEDNKIRAFISSDGINGLFLESTGVDVLGFNKVAVRYSNSIFSLSINGVEVDSVINTITISGLDRISFDNGSGNDEFYGNIKDLRVYTTALTDEELTQLTS